MTDNIKKVAVIGTGVIGAGWIIRCLAHDKKVVGFDKDLKIDKRIDYFFTSKMKTLSYAHIDDRLDDNKHISDHLPVLIKIKIISPTKNKGRQQ